MKLIDLKCNQCGADLKVNEELSQCMCQYCGNTMLIDKEVTKVEIDGYEFEKGRIKAQKDEQERIRQEEIKARAEYNAQKLPNFLICLIGGIAFLWAINCMNAQSLGGFLLLMFCYLAYIGYAFICIASCGKERLLFYRFLGMFLGFWIYMIGSFII